MPTNCALRAIRKSSHTLDVTCICSWQLFLQDRTTAHGHPIKSCLLPHSFRCTIDLGDDFCVTKNFLRTPVSASSCLLPCIYSSHVARVACSVSIVHLKVRLRCVWGYTRLSWYRINACRRLGPPRVVSSFHLAMSDTSMCGIRLVLELPCMDALLAWTATSNHYCSLDQDDEKFCSR